MKYFLFVLVSMSAMAADGDDTKLYREGFDVLRNPSQAVNSVLCKSDDPNAPWCSNLSNYTCQIKKKSNVSGALEQSICDRYTKNIKPDCSSKEFNEVYLAAITAAENEVFGQSMVKRPDVVQVFMDAKTYMRQSITSNPYIPVARQQKMASTIMNINMRTGREYIDELVVKLKTALPNQDKDSLTKKAIEVYQASCGEHGMDVNAFYNQGKFVLCPGLVFSLSDYGPSNKNEVMNALSYTIGHEMGHSIDAVEFPDVYSNMRACYVGSNGGQDSLWTDEAPEITGDYWGTIVLANRLRGNNVKGADAARTVALATDGFCGVDFSAENSQFAFTGEFRVNKTLSSSPALREAMLCEGPTSQAPACMISGRVPR